MNVYQQCEVCRQYINTTTTDHQIVRAALTGKEVHVHMLPCYQRYAEVVPHEVVRAVYNHKKQR